MSNTGSRYLQGQLLYGNLSIFANCANDGSLQIEGSVYTNNILEYNTGSGIIIQNTIFNSSGSIILPTSGSLTNYNTLNSTSASVGSVIIHGGVGIIKDLYVGGNLDVNENIISNVTAPSLNLDAANKWYVDTQLASLTIGNVSGNFTQGQVLVGGTGGNVNGYTNILFDRTGTIGNLQLNYTDLYINDTRPAIGIGTGGSFTTFGGGSFSKNVFIGEQLNIGSRNMTPSQADLFAENIFYANNNQVIPDPIIGFVFNNSTKSFNATVCITIDAITQLDALYELKGIYKVSGWVLNYSYIGDLLGIAFSLNSSGQVLYTSTSIFGHTQTKMRFRALTTSV